MAPTRWLGTSARPVQALLCLARTGSKPSPVAIVGGRSSMTSGGSCRSTSCAAKNVSERFTGASTPRDERYLRGYASFVQRCLHQKRQRLFIARTSARREPIRSAPFLKPCNHDLGSEDFLRSTQEGPRRSAPTCATDSRCGCRPVTRIERSEIQHGNSRISALRASIRATR